MNTGAVPKELSSDAGFPRDCPAGTGCVDFQLLARIRNNTPRTVMFAFNPPIMTLNILNYFSIQYLHNPELLNWNLGGIPGWIKCQSELETKGVRPQVPGR